MKVWKLVSGIFCIVFSGMVIFQSCAAGIVNTLEENATDLSAAGGLFLAILMLAGGIVSIAVRNSGKGGSAAVMIIFLIAALTGFASRGVYSDLMIWSVWCLICAVLAFIALLIPSRKA